MKIGLKQKRRYRRHKRVRAKIYGTARMPRLCVFRPAKHIYAQLIDDEKGMTLASASDRELKKPKIKNKKPKIKIKKEKIKEPQIVLTPTKVAIAYEVGKLIAKKAKNLPAACLSGRQGRQVEKVVFDRAGYKYHGRVKALAQGAREGGLKF